MAMKPGPCHIPGLPPGRLSLRGRSPKSLAADEGDSLSSPHTRGDDIGITNLNRCSDGLTGYRTIDQALGKLEAVFTAHH